MIQCRADYVKVQESSSNKNGKATILDHQVKKIFPKEPIFTMIEYREPNFPTFSKICVR